MSTKLDKYAAERDKARQKRDEWEARMKMWDQKYRELENEEIHDLVHAANLTPDQLAELLKMMGTTAAPAAKPAATAEEVE